MPQDSLTPAQIELLYQALETEQGGVAVYQTALTCAVNEDLRDEWQSYLDETRRHVLAVTDVLEQLQLDPQRRTPGRDVVSGIGQALVAAMLRAKATMSAAEAELVACECVVHAETKDHANWELIGFIADHGTGAHAAVLKAAYDEIEDEEDHHLYHTKGWCRELWIQALGFDAALPPPEEVRQVDTAIGASRAEQERQAYVTRANRRPKATRT